MSGGGFSSKRLARVREVLALAGLDYKEFRKRYPWQLSGGQRQRVRRFGDFRSRRAGWRPLRTGMAARDRDGEKRRGGESRCDTAPGSKGTHGRRLRLGRSRCIARSRRRP